MNARRDDEKARWRTAREPIDVAASGCFFILGLVLFVVGAVLAGAFGYWFATR